MAKMILSAIKSTFQKTKEETANKEAMVGTNNT